MDRKNEIVIVWIAIIIIVSSGALRIRNTPRPKVFGNNGEIVFPPGMGGSTTPPTSLAMGIFQDAGGSESVISLEWGTLYPGQTKQKIIYIDNHGELPFILSMSTSNWSSEKARESISVSWNREGAPLSMDEFISAQITIKIDPSIREILDFSFDIVLSG